MILTLKQLFSFCECPRRVFWSKKPAQFYLPSTRCLLQQTTFQTAYAISETSEKRNITWELVRKLAGIQIEKTTGLSSKDLSILERSQDIHSILASEGFERAKGLPSVQLTAIAEKGIVLTGSIPLILYTRDEKVVLVDFDDLETIQKNYPLISEGAEYYSKNMFLSDPIVAYNAWLFFQHTKRFPDRYFRIIIEKGKCYPFSTVKLDESMLSVHNTVIKTIYAIKSDYPFPNYGTTCSGCCVRKQCLEKGVLGTVC